jgi:hypothetical protein
MPKGIPTNPNEARQKQMAARQSRMVEIHLRAAMLETLQEMYKSSSSVIVGMGGFENYLTLLLENCAADYRLQQTAITVNTPRDEKSTTRWRNRDYHQEIMAVERDE